MPLRDLVRERRDLPVVIDNDVRALSIAEEWFGIGVDSSSFAIVTIGAGIGCGLYVNGDVVEGDHGVAGEIGHLPLGPERPAVHLRAARLRRDGRVVERHRSGHPDRQAGPADDHA